MELLKNSSFNELYWHDAVIKNIIIDRSRPGLQDTILFEIIWPSEANEKRNILIFNDVYWASFNLNFGIIADENILNAFELNANELEVKNVYSKWKGHFNNVNLRFFTINLNSTGGEIKIVCTDFNLENSMGT